MNRTKLLTLLLAGLLTAGSLVACAKTDEGEETGTTAATKVETTPVTAIPRYDYLEADVAKDVSIDRNAYTGVTLTIPDSLRIEDEDVMEYIQKSILFSKREAVNGTTEVKDQALQLGDDAFIYYKGFVDGKEFDGGSNWDDESPYQLGLGSGSFIPGFEDGLVGVVPNETSKDAPFELKVTFPEDYNEELAGKDATFHVVITHAIQYKIPEYNWEFVEKTLKYELKEEFYASDRARLDEFEAYVRETLETQNEENIENAKIDALWTHLIEKATVKNLPQSEIDFYVNGYTSDFEYQYEYYCAYGGDEFKKLYPDLGSFVVVMMGMDKGADWKAEIRTMAEKLVKKDMIGHTIGETEGIESVTDEEYKAQIEYWVTYYSGQMTEAEIVQSMGETFLRQSAYSEKIQAWLMENNTFTYKDGTPLGGSSDDKTETETTAPDTGAADTGAADTTADATADTEA